MGRIVFVQISDKLSTPHNFMRAYYEAVYDRTPGYRGSMPEHYMEIPTWIPILSGMLPNHVYEKEVLTVTDLSEAILLLHDREYEKAVLIGSVMDVNKEFYRHLILGTSQEWILGGYVDPSYFRIGFDPKGKMLNNVTWLNSPKELAGRFYEIDTTAGPDYSMFYGEKFIPRLALSEGCTHLCTFCTIPRVLTVYEPKHIWAQVDAWIDHQFELVYVSDKTFGQADNGYMLGRVGDYISGMNSEFKGFIVQTTVPYARKHLEYWYDHYYVRWVEVGVEMPDDTFLRRMRKPYRERHLYELTAVIKDIHFRNKPVGFVPNLIFGWPEARIEDYLKMHRWVYTYRDIINHINPYVLCEYHDSKGGGQAQAIKDADENTFEKSWLNQDEQTLAWRAMQEVFHLTGASAWNQ